MPNTRNVVTPNPGNTNSLFRFVVAAKLDSAALPRAAVVREWCRSDNRSPATAQVALSRYLSPDGGAIPVSVADGLFAACERLGDSHAEDPSGPWGFHAFHERLHPWEALENYSDSSAAVFEIMTASAPTSVAELFHQAEALLGRMALRPVVDGWIKLEEVLRVRAWAIRSGLLAVCAGGGVQAQRAALLLGRLCADHDCWDQVRSFTHDHPLGARGLGVMTMILQRESFVRRSDERAELARPELVRKVADYLRFRVEHDPPNERLRAARGLMVESLGQLSRGDHGEDVQWVDDALRARATERRRTIRERAFAALMYAKRHGGPSRRKELDAVRDSVLADRDLDELAAVSVLRHFDLALSTDYSSSDAGRERDHFYRWPDRRHGLFHRTPHEDWEGVGGDSARILERIEDAIAAHERETDTVVPASVRAGTRNLIEASVFEVDAVGRRIAIDALRCAGLAGHSSAALRVLMNDPSTVRRGWIRCTAAAGLGLLQHVTGDDIDALKRTALAPRGRGKTSSDAIRKAAYLAIGDLCSEATPGSVAKLGPDDVADLVIAVRDDLRARIHDAPASGAAPSSVHALAYLVGSTRYIHPRLASVDGTLQRLCEWFPEDEFLAGLVKALRDELVEALVRSPDRALDAALLYQLEAHERRLARETVAGARSEEGLRKLVRDIARLEEASFLGFPALYAANAAANLLCLRRSIRDLRTRPGVADLDPTLSTETFERLQDDGIQASVESYRRLMESAGRVSLVPIEALARMLSMLSEGASSQSGVNPALREPIDLGPEDLGELGLDVTEPAPTLFELAAVVLVENLTRPFAEDLEVVASGEVSNKLDQDAPSRGDRS